MTTKGAGAIALTGCRIRQGLRTRLQDTHAGQSLLLIEEFALFGGQTRADLVALNGTLHAFEIKGETDSLDRLPLQMKLYGRVFAHATLVVAPRHHRRGRRIIPPWWGLWIARSGPASVQFEPIREGQQNSDQCPRALAALLWREEALQMLAEHGLASGMRSSPWSQLIDLLVEKIPSQRLEARVRETLKARGLWLPAAQRKRCGGRCRQRAMSLHSPTPPF